MTMDIVVSKDFEHALARLSPSMRENVSRKIRSLVGDPAYPSLKTHRLNQIKSKDIRDCYITDSMRLLFEFTEGCLRLWDLGSHGIVDKVHLRRFDSNTHFHHIEEVILEDSVTETAEVSKPTYKQTSNINAFFETTVVSKQGSTNHFAFFQDTHLRILGVPANLVKSIKSALSIEEALALSGLSVRTRLWLVDIITSVEFESVMLDSSRLLYRTTLDRLVG